MKMVVIYSDGASKGNPGDAGIGVLIRSTDGETLAEIGEYIGKATNNVAEYSAVIRGLEAAYELGADQVEVRSDSELLVKQLRGIYQVKSEKLIPLHHKACVLLSAFTKIRVNHVPREQNRRADELANQGVKNGQRKAVSDSVRTPVRKPVKMRETQAASPVQPVPQTDPTDGGQTTLGL